MKKKHNFRSKVNFLQKGGKGGKKGRKKREEEIFSIISQFFITLHFSFVVLFYAKVSLISFLSRIDDKNKNFPFSMNDRINLFFVMTTNYKKGLNEDKIMMISREILRSHN